MMRRKGLARPDGSAIRPPLVSCADPPPAPTGDPDSVRRSIAESDQEAGKGVGSMHTRRAFTLVEMLVVVAIIAVLIALLLPTMNKARQAATRAACLSDRRQNATQFLAYASDHRGYFMGPDRYNEHADYTSSFGGRGGPYQFSTLAAGGYIEDPATLWCPAFTRPPLNLIGAKHIRNWYWDQPQAIKRGRELTGHWMLDERHIWEDFMLQGNLKGDGHTGVAHFLEAFWAGDGKTDGHRLFRGRHDGKNAQQFFGSRLRLQDIAARWHKRVGPYGGYSPVLVGCADYGWSSTSIYRPAGVPWEGTSHQRRGINGAFFDGSARWFSRDEYYQPPRPAMAPDKNTGHSNPNDMQKWFRFYASF